MRILVITPYLPWPLHSGGNAAQFSTLACLAEDHDFTLLCPIEHDQAAHARELAARLPRVRIRSVLSSPPPAAPPPASLAVRLLRPAVRRARRFFSSPPASPPATTSGFPPLPYNPFYLLPPAFISALSEELARSPEVIQCEFAETLSLGPLLPAHVRRIFVHHQVHHTYAERFLAVQGATPFARYLTAWMRTLEEACLQHFDTIITFSDSDRAAVAQMVPPERVRVSPFPFPADVSLAASVPADFNGNFIFIGSEPHAPNQDALKWLLSEIWPRIAAGLPGSRLIVIGRWSSSWRDKAGSERVEFAGFVEDLGTALSGGIMLVPVRIGSGIRTKILAAFASGTPVISTMVGAEGLLAHDGTECLLRDDAASFAAAAIQLAHDAALRLRLAQCALTLVRTHYSPAAVRHRRNEIYTALIARHRPATAVR